LKEDDIMTYTPDQRRNGIPLMAQTRQERIDALEVRVAELEAALGEAAAWMTTAGWADDDEHDAERAPLIAKFEALLKK
jgi:hypothetical protein